MCFNNIWEKTQQADGGERRENRAEETKRGKQEKNGDPKCNYCSWLNATVVYKCREWKDATEEVLHGTPYSLSPHN